MFPISSFSGSLLSKPPLGIPRIRLASPTFPRARAPRALLAGAVVLGVVLGQQALPARAIGQDAEQALPEAAPVTMETKDGVVIQASFFAAAKPGPNTTPVILLHGLKKDRGSMVDTATALQDLGCSVLSLDLRGHGQSTEVKGAAKKLDPEKMNALQFERMSAEGGDVDRAKGFFMELHNKKEVNIEKTCLVGVDFSCLVALNYAFLDWSYPVLATGKQGQDVAMVVLVSPQYKYKRLNPDAALSHETIRKLMPVYITAGVQTVKARDDAAKFYSSFTKQRPKQEALQTIDERTVFYLGVDSTLQSDELLNEPSLKVIEDIVEKVDLKVHSRPKAWKERKKPI